MGNREEYKNILQSHKLRITDCRLDVIEYFQEAKKTLFQSDLERQFLQYDRVTLYRTLQSFQASGIIHRIPNETGVPSYGLCHDTCSPKKHEHNHIHFKCNNCGTIECMHDQVIPTVFFPEGYHIETVNLIVDGVCASCS